MRNKCEDCCYLSYNNEDCNCGIDPYEFNCEDGCGCPYSQEMLALLNDWQEFVLSEPFSYRIISEYEHAIELEEELKEKIAKGEEIGYWDKEHVKMAWEHYEELYLMDLEYGRCELLRFFKKYDPKGKLKRFLKKKGKYPYWIEDLFYVDKIKEERKKKIKEENNGQKDA